MRSIPVFFLILLIAALYYQFFLFGKIPIPADALVGSYYPWLDYKWGFEIGVPVKNSTIVDAYSAFYVWKMLSFDFIKNLEWPLWNPYSFSGTPFLGSYQTAHFFPFNILLLLPRNLGWGIFIFGQTVVAALGLYFLAGLYIKNSLAKIAGSLVFALSGFMGTWLEFGNGVWAAAMLPWIFYGAENFLKTKKVRNLLILTFFFTSLYLAGLAQMLVFASALFIVYLFYKIIFTKVHLAETFPLLIFWVLTIGIASLAILPAVDLTDQSIRAFEAYSRSFNFGLTPWYEFIRIIAADFFGNPSTRNEWSKLTYFEHSIFLGTLTIPLILPFIFKRFRDQTINFWGIIFVASLFLALDNPINRILYSVPLPFLTYSSSGRIFFLTSFSAAILIALAIEKVESDQVFKKILSKANLIVLFLVLILVITIVIVSTKTLNPLGIGDVSMYKVGLKNLILPAVLLSLLYILLRIKIPKLATFSKRINIITLLIVSLIFLDLGRYFLKFNPFVSDKLIFSKTPVIEFLQKKDGLFRIVRTDDKLLPPNTWINYKISSIEGYDPMALDNYARFFNIVNANSYKSRVSRIVVAKKYRENFLDALNTKYILAVKGSGIEKKLEQEYKRIFEDKNTVIFENTDVLERAYFIPLLTEVSGFEEMVKKIDDFNFDPTTEVVIIGSSKTTNFSTEGEIKITQYLPDKVALETKALGERVLILADAYEKNWKVYINGKKDIIKEVNGSLRGVYIPGGENKIIFRYEPEVFESAKQITLTSLLVLVVLTVYSIRRYRF